MPLSTLGVVSAVTPSVIETYFSHFLNRGPLRQKPTAHISYHEGLRLIRQFLDYSSRHTVEDLQAFTAQWVPAPVWVRILDVDVSLQFLERSASLIQAQLGPQGIEQVGGKAWWQWRRPEAPFRAEWIEMKKDYGERKRAGAGVGDERIILYVHGGAYYFGSVDEHRYQMQRHARKLKARVFAPRYRLAPQFPFPCGLQDCVAAYLMLLEQYSPEQILFGGDSAGGGMVLTMLVTLRDQGVPLPAGTILLSPWVDLTHSFPSVAGDGLGDYIPPHGFHHKPSMVWPPPSSDELRSMAALPMKKKKSKDDLTAAANAESKTPSADRDLTILVDGQTISIKDQIQMYSTNNMLAHPMVSPVQQPSLGGLPPMLIQVGGGELLRDEQIYVAHKAANPKAYPPSDAIMEEYGLKAEDITRYPPTDVHLQVWDDLCHVPHTLSFTRPAKYMYRSVAQFGAWALAHAQHKAIDIMDDDQISIISSGEETDNDTNASTTSLPRTAKSAEQNSTGNPTGAVGKAGDPLPRFKDHMIRQRVDRHGVTYPMALPAELACLHLDPASIGAIKPGPVRKWISRKHETDTKFASEKKKVQKKRVKEMQQGYDVIGPNERPPPTALAGRKRSDMPPEKRIKKSWGLAMWSGWGSSHDESTIEREEMLERQPSIREPTRQPSVSGSTARGQGGSAAGARAMKSETLLPDSAKKRRTSSVSILSAPWRDRERERPRSPYRKITDTGQVGESSVAGDSLHPPPTATSQRSRLSSSAASLLGSSRPSSQAVNVVETATSHQQTPSSASEGLTALPQPPTTREIQPSSTKVEGSENTYQSSTSNRPHNGTVAYPFKIRNPMPPLNPSTTTLNSESPDPAPSSSLAPNATSNEASTTAAPPPPSDDGNGLQQVLNLPRPAPPAATYSDKEIAMPFYEKEVVVNAPDSTPVTPIDSNRAPFRLRNPPSDPRLGKLDTTNSSASGSVPASPADTYRSDPLSSFMPRNPALASSSRFGGAPSPYSEISSPIDKGRSTPPAGPPKPNGFAYNPRDLRNAMLNRQAAESAAALNSSAASGRSTPPARPETPSQSFAVELPAVSVLKPRPSAETLGRASTASRASESTLGKSAVSPSSANPAETTKLAPDPVELSAAPPVRKPVPQPAAGPTAASPPPPADPTVRENIIMPVVEPRKPQPSSPGLPPPPPPPKDDAPTAANETKTLKEKKSTDALSASFPATGTGTGDEKKSRFLPKSKFGFLQAKDKAPRIGEVPGLKEERGIDLDPAGFLTGAGKEGRL